MKEKYLEPICDIIEFEKEDVIITSLGDGGSIEIEKTSVVSMPKLQ